MTISPQVWTDPVFHMKQVFSHVLYEGYASGRPVSGMLPFILEPRSHRLVHFMLWYLDASSTNPTLR